MNKENLIGNLEYIATCLDNIADGLEDAKKLVAEGLLDNHYLYLSKLIRTQVGHINNVIKEV